MDSQHFSNFQSSKDSSSLDVFLGEAAAVFGVWMVPVSLTPQACPAIPQEDVEDTKSIPESSLLAPQVLLGVSAGLLGPGACIWRAKRELRATGFLSKMGKSQEG